MISKYRDLKKRLWANVFFQFFALSLILLAIGFLFFSNYRIAKKRIELKKEISNLEREIREAEEKNRELKEKISQKENPDYWEELARTRLGFQKEGEQQVVILPPPQEKEEKKEEKEKSGWNPRFWWEWLKNKLRD